MNTHFAIVNIDRRSIRFDGDSISTLAARATDSIRNRGFATVNLGEDRDITEWSIINPATGGTVGYAYVK